MRYTYSWYMNKHKRLGTDPVTLSIKLSAIVMQP